MEYRIRAIGANLLLALGLYLLDYYTTGGEALIWIFFGCASFMITALWIGFSKAGFFFNAIAALLLYTYVEVGMDGHRLSFRYIYYVMMAATLLCSLLRYLQDVLDERRKREEAHRWYEEGFRQEKKAYEEMPPHKESAPKGYFFDCRDEKSLKNRYRKLCKAYHPDNGAQNAETFIKIQQEYARMKAQMAR